MSAFLPDPGDLHDYQTTRCVHDTAQWMHNYRESLKSQRITQVSVETCFRVEILRFLTDILRYPIVNRMAHPCQHICPKQVILPGSHDSGAYELSNKAGNDSNWSALRCFLGCCCK